MSPGHKRQPGFSDTEAIQEQKRPNQVAPLRKTAP